MRLADTKSAIVSLSAAERLAARGLRPGLPPLLLELPAVIFFMHASLRTPLILIRMMLYSATNVIDLWQAIEEYGASFEEGVHARSCIRKTVQGNGQSARQASVDRGKIYFADRAAFKSRAVALEMVAAVRFRASCGRPGDDRAWRRPPGHGPQQSRPRWRSLRDTHFVGGR